MNDLTKKLSDKEKQEIKDKFIISRCQLYTKFPFFGRLVMYLDPVLTDEMETAAVEPNGRLLLNPTFVQKLDIPELMFVLCHETMHLVTRTHMRTPVNGNHFVMNLASDCVINYMLHQAGIPFPAVEKIKPIFGGEWAKYDGWFTEPVYFDLLKEHQENCPHCSGEDKEGSKKGKGKGKSKKGSGGDKGDIHGTGWWYDDSASRGGVCSEKEKQKWIQRVAAAAAAAKMAGKLPGNLEMFVTDLLHPKVNWRQELKFRVRSTIKPSWTWRKIGRRTAGGVRTPGKNLDKPSAVVYCDTSGSISDDELRRYLSEVGGIVRACGAEVRLLLGDAVIYYDGEVDLEALKKLPVQRGGTDFRVVFEKLEKGEQTKILIGFTDLCGPFPDASPDFPVVWCVRNTVESQPPFGKIIVIKD